MTLATRLLFLEVLLLLPFALIFPSCELTTGADMTYQGIIGMNVNPYADGYANQVVAEALREMGIRHIRITIYWPPEAHTNKLAPFRDFEVLGVMGENDWAWGHFADSPNGFIESYRKAYPNINDWQFFNEPDHFTRVPPKAYVVGYRIALEIIDGDAYLLPAATSSGSGGNAYFAEMMKESPFSHPAMLTAHYYGSLPALPRDSTLWVTETGRRGWNEQPGWYARAMRDLQRAERIYWYTAWEGEPARDTYSVIGVDWKAGRTYPGPLVELLRRK